MIPNTTSVVPGTAATRQPRCTPQPIAPNISAPDALSPTLAPVKKATTVPGGETDRLTCTG
jgi:hypothetical protein